MKDETKRTVRNLFGSIIKNESAIDGAKTAPWWIALILFIVGSFLPIIPIMVNASKTYGASFVSGATYGYDQALATCGLNLKAESYEMNVKNHELVVSKGGEELSQTWVDDKDMTPIAVYDRVVDGVTSRSLNIYYSDRPKTGSTKTINAMIKTIEATKYAINTAEVYNAEAHGDVETYIPSYLILYRTGMYSKIYKVNTATAGSSTYTGYDWKHTNDCNLLEQVTTVANVEANVLDANYVDGVMNNWRVVFNQAYQTQKTYNFWFTSGLYYGIYLVLGIFMGLMMFLLTRGKNNPNRGLNFFVTCKIDAWITFTPAVLGMIVGFIWNAAAGLAFIVLIGLRTMWLSMRQLSPVQQQY